MKNKKILLFLTLFLILSMSANSIVISDIPNSIERINAEKNLENSVTLFSRTSPSERNACGGEYVCEDVFIFKSDADYNINSYVSIDITLLNGTPLKNNEVSTSWEVGHYEDILYYKNITSCDNTTVGKQIVIGQCSTNKEFYTVQEIVWSKSVINGTNYFRIRGQKPLGLDVDWNLRMLVPKAYNNKLFLTEFDTQKKGWAVWASGGYEHQLTINGTNYTVHVFNVSGNFTLTNPNITNIEILAIGGGGGAYNQDNVNGGGASGGFNYTIMNLSTGTYTIIVGQGGLGCQNGTSSSISKGGTTYINVSGGGHGASEAAGACKGGDGASGGGGTWQEGAGSANGQGEGNNGGTGSSPNNYPAAGGGGATSGGQSPLNNQRGGDGGIGKNSSITGVIVCYAGGGAGSGWSAVMDFGRGNCGGGNGSGNYASSPHPENGTDGTGGGAGAGGIQQNHSMTKGGDGTIIIRYVNPASSGNGGNTMYTYDFTTTSNLVIFILAVVLFFIAWFIGVMSRLPILSLLAGLALIFMGLILFFNGINVYLSFFFIIVSGFLTMIPIGNER